VLCNDLGFSSRQPKPRAWHPVVLLQISSSQLGQILSLRGNLEMSKTYLVVTTRVVNTSWEGC
jgi:hypothetical protein